MNEKRPIIGVTCQRYQGESEHVVHGGYIRSVEEAGGIPLVIPMTEHVQPLAELCDGFVLIGSVADVSPTLYGCVPPKDNYSDPDRDRVDYEILDHASKTGKPVFGICRGCQVINVWRGGTLALHYHEVARTEIEHSDPDYAGPYVHHVKWDTGSSLGQEISQVLPAGQEHPVNSLHRQVANRVGNGLRVAATSEDGLVEALEDAENPELLYAVQWHPERAPEMARDQVSKALFERLVRAAGRKK